MTEGHRWVKSLLHNREGFSLDPRTHIKAGYGAYTYNSSTDWGGWVGPTGRSWSSLGV